MGLMQFMEVMGTSSIPLVAAFFIGLMTAISPCPLASNITAIAYASKKMDSRHTMAVSFIYTFGRMTTYVLLASLIVWAGINVQSISLGLQRYGEKLLGPILLIAGFVMLEVIKPDISFSLGIMERLPKRGYLGSFLLGIGFALAFCPFSAVLYFGMLIPLSIRTADPLLAPSVFAFATGLPVILFSVVLAYSVSSLGRFMGKVQAFERWMRKGVSLIFILVGIYYIGISWVIK